MCGLTAIFSYGGARRPVDEGELARIDAHMIKRGPDGDGLWMAGDGLAGLAHRRLAIIDPGPGGAQPMALDGPGGATRLVITYNGEIYNFRELREELIAAGRPMRSNCDTEVLLHLYDRDGPEMVQRLRGMFALAIYDVAERSLFLARDPFGIKPLYYGLADDLFLFGSELKALRAHPDWTPEINRGALAAYFRYAYVPAPHSIYTGIEKQLPGTIISIGPDGNARTTTYWSLADIRDANKKNLFRGADDEAADELESGRMDRRTLRMEGLSGRPAESAS